MLVELVAWRNLYQKKVHFQKVGKIQISMSLCNSIVGMLFNIPYDTTGYLWTMLNCIQLQGMSLIPYISDGLTIYYCKVLTQKVKYQKTKAMGKSMIKN